MILVVSTLRSIIALWDWARLQEVLQCSIKGALQEKLKSLALSTDQKTPFINLNCWINTFTEQNLKHLIWLTWTPHDTFLSLMNASGSSELLPYRLRSSRKSAYVWLLATAKVIFLPWSMNVLATFITLLVKWRWNILTFVFKQCRVLRFVGMHTDWQLLFRRC